MGQLGDAVTYTLIAVGFALLIFLAALFFVQVSRRRNVRFGQGQRAEKRRSEESVSSRQ
jgi:hypothetical protein